MSGVPRVRGLQHGRPQRLSGTGHRSLPGAPHTDRLGDEGRDGNVLFMTSTGGVEGSESVAAKPVNMVLSGPVGGVVGGVAAARASGIEDIITLDVGGSADIALVSGGEMRNKHWLDNSIGGLQLRLSMVDVSTIGAGGLAGGGRPRRHAQRRPEVGGRRSGTGLLRTRRHRAGVTDAQVTLGRLGASSFLGGRMTIEPGSGRAAIERRSPPRSRSRWARPPPGSSGLRPRTWLMRSSSRASAAATTPATSRSSPSAARVRCSPAKSPTSSRFHGC
ncbi:MAG: hydantoinase/oxoprolinase family protein [Solirubrobacterales bacterium]